MALQKNTIQNIQSGINISDGTNYQTAILNVKDQLACEFEVYVTSQTSMSGNIIVELYSAPDGTNIQDEPFISASTQQISGTEYRYTIGVDVLPYSNIVVNVVNNTGVQVTAEINYVKTTY